MPNKILKDEIELPAAGSLSWHFPVEVHTEGLLPRIVRVKVDTSTLHGWVREAIGRYPDESIGDKRQLEDILANWDAIEPVLQTKFAFIV